MVFEFTTERINQILQLLATHAYSVVAPIIADIHEQANRQAAEPKKDDA